MDNKINALLDQTPERPPRSKLEPHADVIRQLRRKGRTYQEIAHFFAEHLGIKVAPSTIHAYVRVRARRGQHATIELPPDTRTKSFQVQTSAAESEIEIRKRIEELKRRQPPKETEKRVFEYDETEPLELVTGERRKP